MHWKEGSNSKVDNRAEFAIRRIQGEKMKDLCQEFGISRKTGWKFVRRFKENGKEGLKDQSRRPHRLANRTNELTEEIIVNMKMKYFTWGPKKLRKKMEQEYPMISFPSVSTIAVILDRKGLTQARPRRIKRSYSFSQLAESHGPNDIWCIDFKGQFKMLNQQYCYPLTITDHYSRYLLACECLAHPNTEEAFEAFHQCFKEYGLPRIIRSDNGGPFVSVNSLYGLSRLSVWFIQLGIQLERIEPGHPEQNGRHERMHRTLKWEALQTAASNLLQQQEVMDRFRERYNKERPHEALKMETPAQHYQKSEIRYPGMNPPIEYPSSWWVRSVDDTGHIYIGNQKFIRISKVFHGLPLGLMEMDKGWWIRFSKYDIGIIDRKTLEFEPFEALDD